MENISIYVGEEATTHLLTYLDQQKLDKVLVIADTNTWTVLGDAVRSMLKGAGKDVRSVLLNDPEVVPDEETIFQVLYQAEAEERALLAVGTGTITDITRFCAHRTGRPFLSMPTAPSVDGFTSPSCSLSIKRVKTTVPAKPPQAIFADLDVLRSAPRAMIAAGFGDILGKTIALADWKLGHLVWDEPYSEKIAARVRKTWESTMAEAEAIGAGEPAAIHRLMDGLSDSGLCMLAFGNSRPAAGIEHYMSHFLEMKLLREGRPAVLHGAKVALCSVYAAEQYELVKGIDRVRAEQMLRDSRLQDREKDVQTIRRAFPDIAEKVIVEMSPFLNLTEEEYENLKAWILRHWDEIHELAQQVPTAEELRALIRAAGGAVTPEELGLSQEELREALAWAHFFRNRFSVTKLVRILGLVD